MIHIPLGDAEAAKVVRWEPVLALSTPPAWAGEEAETWRWRLADASLTPTPSHPGLARIPEPWCLCGELDDVEPEAPLVMLLDGRRAHDFAELERRRWEDRRRFVRAFGVQVVAWERRCMLGRASPWRQRLELRPRITATPPTWASRFFTTDEATFRQERLGNWPTNTERH